MEPQDVIERRGLEPRDGFDLVAYKVPDPDTDLNEFDCYRQNDADSVAEAWRNNEWHFVGVIVVASRCGIALGSDSMYGIEDGQMPDGDGGSTLVDAFDHTLGAEEGHYDLPGEAIADAKLTLGELMQTPPRVAVAVPMALALRAVRAFDDAASLAEHQAAAVTGTGTVAELERRHLRLRQTEFKENQAAMERLLWGMGED